MGSVSRLCSTLLLLSLLSVAQASDTQASGTPAGSQATSPATQPPPADTSNFTSAKGFVLEDATPVRLRFNRTVSSADAHVGDTVDFEVLQDVSVNGTLVIPKSGLGVGTVTEAQPKRRLARGGKLEINIDYVKLINGDKAALRAVKGGNGGGHTVAMTAGIVATGLLFFPAAPFFLFIKGKDITLPKGAEFLYQWRYETRPCEIPAGTACSPTRPKCQQWRSECQVHVCQVAGRLESAGRGY